MAGSADADGGWAAPAGRPPGGPVDPTTPADLTRPADLPEPAAPTLPQGWSPAPQAPAGGSPPPVPGQGWAPPPGWGAPPGWGGPQPGAPRPGVVPLRPLTLGELLDGSVSVVRRYPRPTLGPSAVVALVSTLLSVLLLALLPPDVFSSASTPADPADLTDERIGGLAAASLGSVVISSFAGLVLSGIITVVVGRAVLGQPMTAGAAWQALRPLLWRLIAVALLTGLIVVGVVLFAAVGATVLVAVGGDAGLAGAVLVVLGALLAAAYLYVRLSLAAPALVLEKTRVGEALRRSGVLVRGSFWRVLGILLLAFVLAQLVGQVLQLPFTVLGGGAGLLVLSADVSRADLVLASVGAGVAQVLVAPFTSGVRALLYIDRRMRAEGLDVALSAAAARTG